MTGLILRRHALTHPALIIHAFGLRAWLRLALGRYSTGLAALTAR